MALQKAGVQLVVEGGAAATAAMASFGRAVNDAADQTHRASGRVSGAGQIMVGALRQVGVVAVDAFLRAGRAAAGFVADSVKAAGDFQQGMNVLKAVTGATDAEMAKLQKTAIALGNDISLPATSASDAAEAMTELAKAGLSVEQSMAAAKGTLQLATAAEVDNAKAAQIVAGALNAFHLEGSQAVQVADLLAAAANASSASMTDLSQGLQQGGFMFNATGQKVDDLVASLAILTNVGLTGSDAGTALKNAMTRLVNPTDKAAKLMAELGINVFDAQGKMLPFRDIIGVLNQSLAGMTDEQRLSALSTIFLSDGMKAMLPLLDAGVTGFDAMKEKVNQQGAAAQLAGAQTAGFNGALGAMKNAAETLGLTIGLMLLPPLTDFLNNYVTPGIGWLSGLATAISESNMPLQTFAAYVSAANPTLGLLVQNISAATASTTPLGAALTYLATTFTTAETPIQGFLAVLATISPGFALVQSVIEQAMPAIQMAVTAGFGVVQTFMQTHGTAIQTFIQTAWANIQVIITTATQLIGGIVTGAFLVIAEFLNNHSTEIQAILGNAWTIISNLIMGALEIIKGLLQAALLVFQNDWQGAWTTIQTMSEGIVRRIGDIIVAGLDLIANAFGTSLREIADLWQHNFEALISIATSFIGQFIAAGQAIVDGIINGVQQRAGALFSTLRDLAEDALNAAKSAIGISSPSRDFAKEVGAPMVQGAIAGIERESAALSSSISSTVSAALEAAKGPLATASSIGKDVAGGVASGINAGAGAAINAAKSLADKIRDALSFSVGGGGGGGYGWGVSDGESGGGSWGGGDWGASSMSKPATAAQIMSAGATTINNTQSRTYNYSPVYGAAPRAPSTDFATMAAWGA